jgi:hypothetical protein
MGIEFFLLILLGVAGAVAGIFFLGGFGAAKAAAGEDGEEGKRPTHVYVENETEEKPFGVDSTDQVRRGAEEDPDTEIRS